MSEVNTAEREDRDPSTTRDVLSELVSLRQREGITPARVKVEAPALLELRVVSDQMDYRGFEPGDRHLGGYTAIGCAIDHSVRSLLHRRLLRLTLNYATDARPDSSYAEATSLPGWEMIATMNKLGTRDLFAQSVLLMTNKNTYAKTRDEAYADLADALVLSDYSPCRPAQAKSIGQMMQGLMLDQCVALFSQEGQSLLRDALARRILEELPGSPQNTVPEGVAPAAWLISRMQNEFAPLYAEVRQESEQSRYAILRSLLDAPTLISLLTGPPSTFFDRLVDIARALVPGELDANLLSIWFEDVLATYEHSLRWFCLIMAGPSDDLLPPIEPRKPRPRGERNRATPDKAVTAGDSDEETSADDSDDV